MFTDEIRRKFKQKNYSHVVEEVESTIEKFNELCISRLCPPSNEIEEQLAHRTILFSQYSLFRTRALFDAWIDSIKAENVLSCAIVTRAHYETTGSLALYYKYLKQYYDNKIDIEQLSSKIEKVCLGCKIKTSVGGMVEPNNVYKGIDAFDNFLKIESGVSKINGYDKSVRTLYDILSEYSHPNVIGLAIGGDIDNKNIARFNKKMILGETEIEICALIKPSVDTYFEIFDRISKLINANEKLPNFKY